jgi:hypothetical protein
MSAPRRWQRPLSVLLVIVVLAGSLLAASAFRQMTSPAAPVVASWCNTIPGPC